MVRMKKTPMFLVAIMFLATASNAMPVEKTHNFEIGPEISDFSFRQPGLAAKDSGALYGAYGIYTFTPHTDNWLTDIVDVFTLDAHFGIGDNSYKGGGGKFDVTDYVVEPRFLVGKEFSSSWINATPYLGFGYRYFLRDVILADGLVDDIYHYYYLPFGVELEKDFENGWKIRAKLEYDHLLRGYYKAP